MEANESPTFLSLQPASGADEREWQEMARAALKRIARDERIKALIAADRRTHDLLLGGALATPELEG